MSVPTSTLHPAHPTTRAPISDEALAVRFLTARDTAAFTALVRRNQDLAYRVAFGRCGSAALAEEIVQEAFLRLARIKCRFAPSGPGSFRRWLCRVVTNAASRHLRSEVRAIRPLKENETQEARLATSKSSRATRSAPLSEDTRLALEESLGELTQDMRLPIILYYFQGLTQEETGQLIGVSQTLIARRIQQGLNLLRKRLNAHGISWSAFTLPLLLRCPDRLLAPELLRTNPGRLPAPPTTNPGLPSTRAKHLRPRGRRPGLSIAGTVWAATACVAALSYHSMSGPAPRPIGGSEGSLQEAAPLPPAHRPGSPQGAFTWTFDAGRDEAFERLVRLPAGVPDLPLPNWMPKEGVRGTGALCFPREGGSLLLPIAIPTGSILPIRLAFEVKALSATAELGTTCTSRTGLNSRALATLPKPLRVTTWHTGRWVRWERRIMLRDDGRIDSTQSYGEQPVGQVGVASSKGYTTPGERIYAEIHGSSVLIDNVRFSFGPAAAKELAGEAASSHTHP